MELNKHLGSDFDEFLQEEELSSEVVMAAVKRVLEYQLEKLRNTECGYDK